MERMKREQVRFSYGCGLADFPSFLSLGMCGQGCFSTFSSVVSMAVGDARTDRGGGFYRVDLRGSSPQFPAPKYVSLPLCCCHQWLEFPDCVFMFGNSKCSFAFGVHSTQAHGKCNNLVVSTTFSC